MGKWMLGLGRVFLIAVAVLLALVLLAWGSGNLIKYVLYQDYYGGKTNICTNPALSEGFVCQGITASDEDGKIFVSGYMTSKAPSRIYVTDESDNLHYVTLMKNGEAFTGHAGGLAYLKGKLYIANGKRVYTVEASAVLEAENGSAVEIGEGVPVNNNASFAYSDGSYLYVGEFHDGGKYVTKHPYSTPDGDYCAIVCRYSPEDLTKPEKVYSIRDRVQGICFTPDGRVILSTSYGITSSVFYVYNDADAIDSGEMLDGAPVYYLNGCVKEIKGPAMAEGLGYYKGQVITLFESACNKYIFGKFFFANKIVSVDFS